MSKGRDPVTTLSLPDRFYIENNPHLSIEELANNLIKPVELVKAYCEEWLANNPPSRSNNADDLVTKLTRDGVVLGLSMTEAASMLGDEARGISLETINEAMARGEYQLAEELKVKYHEQESRYREMQIGQYSTAVHYIRPGNT